MPDGKWSDFVAQSIFHTIVASLIVEALLRLWRVRSPDERLAFRLLALAQPLVVSPVLFFAWPMRGDASFHDGWSLFSGRHWSGLRLGPVTVFQAWLAFFALFGTALFLMDLLPLVWGRRRGRASGQSQPLAVAGAVASAAEAARIAPPPVAFLDLQAPVLFCTGVRRPGLVVSRGAIELLDRAELQAALAHELGHIARRDPTASWVVMGARALMFFNPAFQIVARAMARDAELRADDRACERPGERLALASALLKLYRATEGRAPSAARRTLPLAGALSGPLRRARAGDIEARCRRLMEAGPSGSLPFLAPRLVLTAGSLATMLFFVT